VSATLRDEVNRQCPVRVREAIRSVVQVAIAHSDQVGVDLLGNHPAARPLLRGWADSADLARRLVESQVGRVG
jgi:hypothetical protein